MKPTITDAQLDASLQRLPCWQPPADFARRLAASAAAQRSTHPAVPARVRTAGRVLNLLGEVTLIGACVYTLVLVVGATLPWALQVSDTPQFTWTCITALLTVAAWFTNRAFENP